VTGTQLASTGDDGKVRLWKRGHDDTWQCSLTVAGDNNDEDSADDIGTTTSAARRSFADDFKG
jgi:hypothetical protein